MNEPAITQQNDHSPAPQQRGRSGKWLSATVLIIAALVGVTWMTMGEARSNAQRTLQQIFDEDNALKILKVDSVYLPFQAGMPMADVLVNLGIVPRRINGTLTIARKDGSKMKSGCNYGEYDFNQSDRGGRTMYSIDGQVVFKLKACAGALGNLLGDE